MDGLASKNTGPVQFFKKAQVHNGKRFRSGLINGYGCLWARLVAAMITDMRRAPQNKATSRLKGLITSENFEFEQILFTSCVSYQFSK